MLAAAQRLRRSTEFAAAVRGGRRASRGVVVVHLTLPRSDENVTTDQGERKPPAPEITSGGARAGFVVSRAVGGAVTRNTVRRRLRHLVRDRLDRLPTGATLVVRALPGAADAPYARLGADLDAALGAVSASGTPRAAR